jgi:hypothetical protein
MLGAVVALAGCIEPSTAPEVLRSRSLGVLQLESSTPSEYARPANGAERWTPSLTEGGYLIMPPIVIEAPDTVSAGEQVNITVRTIGQDGCWRADGGELAQRGDTITIQPYDRHSGAAVCTTAIAVSGLPHFFSASFSSPGEAIIRVNGRRIRQHERGYEIPVAVERTVTVVP